MSGAIPHAARQKLKPAPPASKPSPRIKTARHFSNGYEIGGEDRARRSENRGAAWGEVEAKFRANGAEVAGDQWGRQASFTPRYKLSVLSNDLGMDSKC